MEGDMPHMFNFFFIFVKTKQVFLLFTIDTLLNELS